MDVFSSSIQEQQKAWGFDGLCFVDDNAAYYDSQTHFSPLSHENVTDKLLTRQEPVILDNVIFEDARFQRGSAQTLRQSIGMEKRELMTVSISVSDKHPRKKQRPE